MAREKWALLLLLSLVAGAGWNIHRADRLCREMELQLTEAESSAAAADWDTARDKIEAAVEIWLDAEEYTHIFIRHSEIDAASDIFYDLRGDILAEDGEAAEANGEKLLYHLQSIYAMERLSFKSIF